MAGPKRCPQCQATYDVSHWAHTRERCPACDSLMLEIVPELAGMRFEHYDSSADIRFDLSRLLTPSAQREVWIVFCLGLGLLVLAFLTRFLFVFFGSLEGLLRVPLWLDLLVIVLLGTGVLMLVWSLRRWWRHRRAQQRSSR